ncbi:MAG: alpha/beta hydrolase [Pseudolysinimonas sp.]|uniref:esterase/lipase family protein n=1 Tax=Pseudolysinimonas sp. TaxID=2680009 RepID=UPI003263F400
MRWVEYAGQALRDYPRAMRMRGFGFAAPVPSSFGAGDARPVVLIPGVYERWQFLRSIALRLSERGHPIHVVRELGINTADIPASAERVLRFLAARDLHGAVLVAHSKGGLIGKSAMLADRDGRIDRLVAVATPFSGSRMADLMILPALRAFRPEHPVIRRLVRETRVNSRITSIYPSFDPHVPEGSALEGATNVPLRIVGHFRVLEDPAAIAAVVAAVEREG